MTREIQVKAWVINLWSIALVLLILIGYAGYTGRGQLIPKLVNDLEQGRYSEVKEQIDDLLNRSAVVDAEILKLHQQLTKRLHLKINFHCPNTERNPKKPNQPNGSSLAAYSGKVTLRSGDSYRFECIPVDNCFLYIFQIDSTQNIDQLFPDPKTAPEHNLLYAGKTCQIPPDNGVLILDENTGKETIYFVASRWRARDLEELFARYSKACGEDEKKDEKAVYRKQLLERIRSRRMANAAGIYGCFYKEYGFWHE